MHVQHGAPQVGRAAVLEGFICVGGTVLVRFRDHVAPDMQPPHSTNTEAAATGDHSACDSTTNRDLLALPELPSPPLPRPYSA